MTRRGTTLLELLLVLVFLGLLTPLMVQLVIGVARTAADAIGRVGAERDATAITGLLGHDLRSAAAADIASPAAGVLEYPRPIGEGLVCAVDAGRPVIRRSGWLGTRWPVSGRDALVVLVVADPATWLRRELVAIGAHSCPDGAAGLLLTPDIGLSAAMVVRVVEPVRLRAYASAGRRWLGLEPLAGGASIQPLAGPLVASGWSLQLGAALLQLRFAGARPVTAALALPLE